MLPPSKRSRGEESTEGGRNSNKRGTSDKVELDRYIARLEHRLDQMTNRLAHQLHRPPNVTFAHPTPISNMATPIPHPHVHPPTNHHGGHRRKHHSDHHGENIPKSCPSSRPHSRMQSRRNSFVHNGTHDRQSLTAHHSRRNSHVGGNGEDHHEHQALAKALKLLGTKFIGDSAHHEPHSASRSDTRSHTPVPPAPKESHHAEDASPPKRQLARQNSGGTSARDPRRLRRQDSMGSKLSHSSHSRWG